MDLEQQLREEFRRAIDELVKPPVLVGANWLRSCPSGKPADFQFMGTGKMAKATGKAPRRIARGLLKIVKLKEIGLRAELAPNGTINLWKVKSPKKPPSGSKEKKGSQAENGKP